MRRLTVSLLTAVFLVLFVFDVPPPRAVAITSTGSSDEKNPVQQDTPAEPTSARSSGKKTSHNHAAQEESSKKESSRKKSNKKKRRKKRKKTTRKKRSSTKNGKKKRHTRKKAKRGTKTTKKRRALKAKASRSKRSATPKVVQLPAEGRHPAAKILELASQLRGRLVRIDSSRIRDLKIDISAAVADSEVTLEELKVLLAVYRVYLFDHTDPEKGDVLIASTNPRWVARKPRYTHVIDVAPGYFDRVLQIIDVKLSNYNAQKPTSEERAVATPARGTAKILLRAGAKPILDQCEALAREASRADPKRPRMYAYIGRFRLVGELRDSVLAKLSVAEQAQARFVVRDWGNQLLYRAPPDIGSKITDLLERFDRRSKSQPTQRLR